MCSCIVDFELNGLNKEANALQKQIAAKKKVLYEIYLWYCLTDPDVYCFTDKAKESADDILEAKKALGEKIEETRKRAKEAEHAMRTKAGTIGNLVGKSVPVSQTEVCYDPHVA